MFILQKEKDRKEKEEKVCLVVKDSVYMSRLLYHAHWRGNILRFLLTYQIYSSYMIYLAFLLLVLCT